MLDILTIGDSTIDLYMKIGDQGVSEHSGEICFFHGSKVIVDTFDSFIAGNSVNVAIGCTKLGLKTAIYTELGNDTNGHRIINELKNLKINTKFAKLNQNAKTNVHAVIVHGDDRTIFSHHGKFDYKMLNWPKPKWIYYTSMGYGFQDFQQQLVNYIKQNPDIGIAFNPGSIQMKEGLEKMRDILKVTHVLLVNKEEAIKLVGQVSLEALHQKLQTLGPKMTVITQGKQGSSADDTREFIQMPVYEVPYPIVDKTGAGDAFSSGFVSALAHKKSLKEALMWGAINSGNTIKEMGAINGLTTKRDMEELIKQANK